MPQQPVAAEPRAPRTTHRLAVPVAPADAAPDEESAPGEGEVFESAEDGADLEDMAAGVGINLP